MRPEFPTEWRTQSKWKRKFYAKYMGWMERIGYLVVVIVIGAFIFAFNYKVDDIISADKVPITAAFEPVTSSEPVILVKQITPDFSEVKAGQPLFSVVSGDLNIRRFLAWESLSDLGTPPAWPKPPLVSVKAKVGGVFVGVEDPHRLIKASGDELGQIRNYQDLRLAPTLTGQGTANAKTGGTAVIKNILVEPINGVLVRGNAQGRSIISGQLVSQGDKDKVEAVLKSLQVSVRDDLPMKLDTLTEMQVDSDITLSDGASANSIFAEPPADSKLAAEILSGKQVASVQFADLPSDLRPTIEAIIKGSIKSKSITEPNGDKKKIVETGKPNTVFKVKAIPEAGDEEISVLNATALTRGFEASLRIKSPPAYLIEALKMADKAGKLVTAKVELKTGDRPIATLLLKRS